MPAATRAASTSLAARGPQALAENPAGGTDPPAGQAASGGIPEPGGGGSQFQARLSTSCRSYTERRWGSLRQKRSQMGPARRNARDRLGDRVQATDGGGRLPSGRSSPKRAQRSAFPLGGAGTCSSPCPAAAQTGPTLAGHCAWLGTQVTVIREQRAQRGDGIVLAQPPRGRGQTSWERSPCKDRECAGRTWPGDKEEVQPEPTETEEEGHIQECGGGRASLGLRACVANTAAQPGTWEALARLGGRGGATGGFRARGGTNGALFPGTYPTVAGNDTVGRGEEVAWRGEEGISEAKAIGRGSGQHGAAQAAQTESSAWDLARAVVGGQDSRRKGCAGKSPQVGEVRDLDAWGECLKPPPPTFSALGQLPPPTPTSSSLPPPLPPLSCCLPRKSLICGYRTRLVSESRSGQSTQTWYVKPHAGLDPPLPQFTHLHGFQRFFELLPLGPIGGMAQKFLQGQERCPGHDADTLPSVLDHPPLPGTGCGSEPGPQGHVLTRRPGFQFSSPTQHRQQALTQGTHCFARRCPQTCRGTGSPLKQHEARLWAHGDG